MRIWEKTVNPENNKLIRSPEKYQAYGFPGIYMYFLYFVKIINHNYDRVWRWFWPEKEGVMQGHLTLNSAQRLEDQRFFSVVGVTRRVASTYMHSRILRSLLQFIAFFWDRRCMKMPWPRSQRFKDWGFASSSQKSKARWYICGMLRIT